MNIKATTIILTAALAIMACASEKGRKTADGTEQATTMTEREAAARGFTAIVTKGHYDIYYTQGSATSVRLKGDDDAVRNTTISCDGRTLTISGKNKRRFSMANTGDVAVYVTSPRLEKVGLYGSGDFKTEGNVKADGMAISIAGSGDVDMRSLDCTSCELSIAGSGDIGVGRIKAGKLTAAIAGSGDINLSNADIKNADCSIAGSGDIGIHGRVGSCNKHIAGSGTINVVP